MLNYMSNKECIKCNEIKDLNEFYLINKKKNKRSNSCKTCHKINNRRYRLKNKEKIKQYRLDNKEKIREYNKSYRSKNKNKVKEIGREYYERNKDKLLKYNKEWNKNNKDKISQYSKKYYINNKEKVLNNSKEYYYDNKVKVNEYSKKYYKNNKEKFNNYNKIWRENNKEKCREYARNRYKKSKELALEKWMRNILYRTEQQGFTRQSVKTVDELGYSPKQLIERIECQFKDGMSWENRSDWHIDHKKPISKFIKGTSAKTINMLCNLQPIWAKDNLKKNNKS